MAKILVTEEGKVLTSDNKIYTHTPKVSGVKNITSNGTYDVSDYAQAEVNVPQPTGKIEITSTEEYDVSSYEKAQVVDSNLEPQNIVKDVTILGVTGTFEGGGGNTLKNLLDNTKSAQSLFSNYAGDNLSDLIKYNDTENVTTFSNMYYDCSKATSFPQIDTSKGTNFSNMYYNDYNATSFPILETSNGTNFSYMYYCCTRASYLKLDTTNANKLSNTFQECGRAYKLEITHFNITSTSNTSNMVKSCYSLKALIIRSFGASYVLNSNAFTESYWLLGTTNSTYNPNGEQGYIYVPRDMISILQNETNWSAMQFRALEDYTLDGTTTGEFDDEKAGLV